MARCGVASRRKSDELIKKGAVQVNGTKVLKPFIEVNSGDCVKVYGRTVSPEKYVYIAVNKPAGYTCTVKDRFAEKKVISLVPESHGRLFPVGRLDKNTSGLLILTNDGEFANRLTHPRYQVEKEYTVMISPSFNNRDAIALKSGISDEGESLQASSVKPLKIFPGRSVLSVVMKEGKKREVRRMFEALGYRVIELKRIRIGGIKLGYLKTGGYRILTEKEKQSVFPSSSSVKKTNLTYVKS